MGKVREVMDSQSHPALLLVDGVSSIGALNFEFDAWKVDVAVTGSQKALSLPTGLVVLAISDKVNDPAHTLMQTAVDKLQHRQVGNSIGMSVCAQALEARKGAKLPRVYYDWDDQLGPNASGNTPYTPIAQLLYGLQESLALLKAEGFDNVVKRHYRWITCTALCHQFCNCNFSCNSKCILPGVAAHF